MKRRIIYLLLFFITINFSCVTNRKINYLQEGKDIPTYEKKDYENYKLLIGDELTYRVISLDPAVAAIFSPRLSGADNQRITYRIYEDGTVDVPFLDSIPVVGLTLAEASVKLTEAFKKVIPDAEVKVALANDKYYVLGSLSTSNAFNLPREKITIFEALAMAGNMTKFGDRKKVRIIRETQEGTLIKEFDMRAKTILDSEYYYVQANDLIYVSEIKGQFFGVKSYPLFMSTISTTLSFLLLALGYATAF